MLIATKGKMIREREKIQEEITRFTTLQSRFFFFLMVTFV